jgi:hypothetical protein
LHQRDRLRWPQPQSPGPWTTPFTRTFRNKALSSTNSSLILLPLSLYLPFPILAINCRHNELIFCFFSVQGFRMTYKQITARFSQIVEFNCEFIRVSLLKYIITFLQKKHEIFF